MREVALSQQNFLSPLSFCSCPVLLPHVLPSLLTFSANELTVGKVYAALMIFDYYKQNQARRLQQQQQQQQNFSGSQVKHPHTTLTCLHNTYEHECTKAHTHWIEQCKPVRPRPQILILHTQIHFSNVCFHVHTHAKMVLCIH